jgi:chromosomal replication initiation ATPase DnaA
MNTTNRGESAAGVEEVTLARVAEAYGVSPAALIAPGRNPLLVEARRVTMQLLAERGLGASHIGRVVRRDHSTVLHHLAVLRTSPTPEEQEMLADLRAPVLSQPSWGKGGAPR